MSAAKNSKFTVGLISDAFGRAIRKPMWHAVLTAIDEAKRGGADYVLTPEMTNIMAVKRERLFANIVADESDPTLGDFARGRAQAWDLHPYRVARDQGVAGEGGEPLVSHRPPRRHRRALRQDPHVRRRSRRRRELSGIQHLPRWRACGGRRSAVGPDWPDGLLRLAFPGALSRARRGRRLVPGHSFRVHPADR